MLHPGRVVVVFEGSERAVSAQVDTARALVGGDETDMAVWDESRERQAASKGRVRFDPGDLPRILETLTDAVIRPSAGVAFTADESPSNGLLQGPSSGAELLAERIRMELDPRGVLSG